MESRFMKRTNLGAVVGVAMLAAGVAQAAGVPGQGTWETTLQPRELDGNLLNGPEAFYDTVLDITWLADMNYAFTSGYAAGGMAPGSANGKGIIWTDGRMGWDAAKTWADNLVVGGVGGWRLPEMVDTGAPGCDQSYAGGTDCGYNVDTATSEMAHLYYVTLGNLAYCPPGDATCAAGPQAGWGLTNTGEFQNLLHSTSAYWSGTEYAPSPYGAWYFGTYDGSQYSTNQNNALYAMAVRPGDVAAVPEPQTYAMLLLGLSALLLAVRRRPH